MRLRDRKLHLPHIDIPVSFIFAVLCMFGVAEIFRAMLVR